MISVGARLASFGYILGWSRDLSLNEFRDSFDVIQKCADRIIGSLETGLLRLERENRGIKSRLDEGRKRSDMQKGIKKERTDEKSHVI